MAPYLEYSQYRFKGLNIFETSLCPEDAKKWYESIKNGLPNTIVPGQLEIAPQSAIQLLRNAGRQKLLAGLGIGEVSGAANPKLGDMMDCVADRMVKMVGQTYEETYDHGESRNTVIPLADRNGRVVAEVVINNAFGGVGWRLPQGHPLIQAYPQLGRVVNEDTDYFSRTPKSFLYVPSFEMAAYTDRHINSKQFAFALSQITSFICREEYIPSVQELSVDQAYLNGYTFYTLNIGSRQSGVYLELAIDLRTGLKVVQTHFTWNPNKPPGLIGEMVTVDRLVAKFNQMPNIQLLQSEVANI